MAVNRLGRLGRLSGIWLDMATRSQNQGMLGHPGAIRMILLHGESCNFSTTLPNMADGATCCILSGRPLEGETTLFGWSGLVWIAGLLPRSASLECVGL